MSKKEKVSVSELFSRLELFSSKEEHEGVLDCSQRILAQTPEDFSAIKAFAVSAVKLDKYSTAYTFLEKNSSAQAIVPLEYAYTLYKLGKHEELTQLVEKHPDNKGIKHVFAQSLYKIESFDRALDVYRELIKSDAGVSNEKFDLSVNERAVIAQSKLNKLALANDSPVSEEYADSYDQLFNLATSYIGQGKYDLAVETLKSAKIKCQTNSSLSPEDIASDLTQILVQAAYASFKAGKDQEAQQILNSIDVKELDPVLRYIVNTNRLIIDQDTNQQLSNPNLGLRAIEAGSDYNKIVPKLVFSQVQIVNNNKFNLELKAGKDVKNLLKSQQKKSIGASKSLEITTVFTDIEELPVSNQVKLLSKHFQKSPIDSRLAFSLAQLYTNQGDYNLAAATLFTHVKVLEVSDPSMAYSPGYVAALTSLFKKSKKFYNAVDYFEKAVNYHSTFESNTDISDLIKEASLTLAGFDRETEQIKNYLEAQYEKNPNDITLITSLFALGDDQVNKKYDSQKNKLNSVSSLISGVDADSLEKLGIAPLLKKPSANQYKVTKKSKTRKARLPKDYDPAKTPDPERWMPKRDRSTWKPKKKERRNNKNVTQGGQVDEALSVEQASTPAPSSSTVKNNKSKNVNKKKKKGRK
ncbi:hypothetical protein DV451_000116 [Geotrichum candidum]|uniref:Signal recognition particle subunit SRP72 n=1 Tax=Geotrichum candidum TaxID=1173061 RepID=A0A9P5G8Z9_GEOCN|nr:hypothetical protein DV451_000116 [Geotrichum candidum]KAF5110298.1 hypothetical protein DV453_000953 [Geotrichum candidum]